MDTTSLELFWLGNPRVELRGKRVGLETRKATALLAYISLSDHPVSRERLAALFWPEYDQKRAPANLRRCLSALRARIPGNLIVSDRHGISLREGPDIRIDVRRLRGLMGEGNPDVLEEAVGLFRGEFLEGLNLPDCPDFDHWQAAERERVRLDSGAALEKLARARTGLGQWEQALAAARRWAGLDALHEPAQALLIRLLALTGRRSAAIRQYEDYAELLRAELGQDPEAGTTALYNDIVSRLVAPAVQTNPGLLRSKLTVPPVREGAVQRGRLLGLIEEGVARGLTVISAPAGFGKSTMVSQWATRARIPTAWVSLDAGDNDILSFLSCTVGAVAAALDIVLEADPMLHAVPPASTEAVLTHLINGIEKHGKDIALVIDDYQCIQEGQVHSAVQFLAERGPPRVRLIIATREDPPLPLARLRSRGALMEIRAEALRFTGPEAERFLRKSMSLSLTADQIGLLERRTEGWIAGLQIAALSLRDHEDAEEFLSSFSGTHRHVLDYLAEEVFARQRPEVKRFLLDTSIVDRLCPELCDVLSDRSESQETLERLERLNLFVVPLDDTRTWYRYHHLFSDLLRHWLAREHGPEYVRSLHARAGDWFAGHGEMSAAVQEYLHAGAFEQAMALIEKGFFDMVTAGGLGRMFQWCSQMPSEALRDRPQFSALAAWAFALTGRGEEASRMLDWTEQAIPSHGGRRGADDMDVQRRSPSQGGRPQKYEGGSAGINSIRATVSALRAFLADLAGDSPRAVELAQTAVRLLPDGEALLRPLASYILGKSCTYDGELEKAADTFSSFMQGAREMGNIWLISNGVYELAHVRLLQARLRDAQALLDGFEESCARMNAAGYGPIAKTRMLAVEVMREHGQCEPARRIAEEASAHAETWGFPADAYVCRLLLARVLRSSGLVDAAMKALESVRNLPREAMVFAYLQPAFEAERVRIWLVAGDLESAEAWVKEYRPGKSGAVVNRELELISLARVEMAGRSPPKERTYLLLEKLARAARRAKRFGPLIEILLLKARLAWRRSMKEEAMAAFDEALRLAQPEGYLTTFVEEGEPATEMLKAGLKGSRWRERAMREYARELLGAFRNGGP